jgi:hypothetical protein
VSATNVCFRPETGIRKWSVINRFWWLSIESRQSRQDSNLPKEKSSFSVLHVQRAIPDALLDVLRGEAATG